MKGSKLFLSSILVMLLVSVFFVIAPNGLMTHGKQISVNHNPVIIFDYPIELNFSTYLGDIDYDTGNGIDVGIDGSCYVVGTTTSSNFPTLNAYDSTSNGGDDVFISKFSAKGSLLWSTFLGGSIDDRSTDISVAYDGSCYVTGYTWSNDFPTWNAIDNSYNGGLHDAFVTKYSSNGTLLWSAYLGGTSDDIGQSIAVDSKGHCYVSGYTISSDFPILNAYDSTPNGDWEVFVTKFNTSGSLIWSTYLGGSDYDRAFGIDVGNNDSCYLTGYTRSSNFPTLNAYNSTHSGGDYDAFVTKFNASGNLLWSTYLGGTSSDSSYGIAVASDGSCYVSGSTESSDFPILNAYDPTPNGDRDIFVTKFNDSGSLLWSTFHGGSNYERSNDIAVGIDDSCFVTGYTFSTDYPTVNAHYSSMIGDFTTIVSMLSYNGSLLWSTYLGGSSSEEGHAIAAGNNTCCYVTGKTSSDDFPTLNAYDSTYRDGNNDAFVTKFSDDFIGPVISDVQYSPSNPIVNESILITSTVNDVSDIQQVTLSYRINGSSWQALNMMEWTSNTYIALLDLNLKASSLIEYFIEATDNSPPHNYGINNNNSQYYSILIAPTPVTTVTFTTVLSPAFGILASLFTIPVIVFVKQKRKK